MHLRFCLVLENVYTEIVLVRLVCFVKDGLRGFEVETPVPAHRVVRLDGQRDGHLRGGKGQKFRVEIEFIFQNAVHPFGDRILIAVVFIRHARTHSEFVQAREVVVTAILGAPRRSQDRASTAPRPGRRAPRDARGPDSRAIRRCGVKRDR